VSTADANVGNRKRMEDIIIHSDDSIALSKISRGSVICIVRDVGPIDWLEAWWLGRRDNRKRDAPRNDPRPHLKLHVPSFLMACFPSTLVCQVPKFTKPAPPLQAAECSPQIMTSKLHASLGRAAPFIQPQLHTRDSYDALMLPSCGDGPYASASRTKKHLCLDENLTNGAAQCTPSCMWLATKVATTLTSVSRLSTISLV
jgi:hypothetical protein